MFTERGNELVSKLAYEPLNHFYDWHIVAYTWDDSVTAPHIHTRTHTQCLSLSLVRLVEEDADEELCFVCFCWGSDIFHYVVGHKAGWMLCGEGGIHEPLKSLWVILSLPRLQYEAGLVAAHPNRWVRPEATHRQGSDLWGVIRASHDHKLVDFSNESKW